MALLLVLPRVTSVATVGWWVGWRLAGWQWCHSYLSGLLEWLDVWASLSIWSTSSRGLAWALILHGDSGYLTG